MTREEELKGRDITRDSKLMNSKLLIQTNEGEQDLLSNRNKTNQTLEGTVSKQTFTKAWMSADILHFVKRVKERNYFLKF
jgi:hypothetical protein